ncbi:hypothetical protein ACOJTA_12660 [Malaciobacter sp. WC5094]
MYTILVFIIIIVILLIVFKIRKQKLYKIEQEKGKNEKSLTDDDIKKTVETQEQKTVEKNEDSEDILYQLNINKVRYKFFNSSEDLNEFSYLYHLVIYKNLFINEPFHSKFYEILLTLEKNDFMIIDPFSDVLILNVRDRNNETQTSKSYQVFRTNNIVDFVIRQTIDEILEYNRKDAQNILIAIMIFLIKESVYYLDKSISLNTTTKLLENYEHKDCINYITKEIKENN